MSIRKAKKGQFVVIAVLMIALMIISVTSYIYATSTYYRQESWEDYLDVVKNLELSSQRVLEAALANFTQRFRNGTITDKESWEDLVLRRILNDWQSTSRSAYVKSGLELSFEGEGGRTLASRWYIPEGDTHLIKCYWYSSEAISSIYSRLEVNLTNQGLYGYQKSIITYLHVSIDTSYMDGNPPSVSSLNLTVTREEEVPLYDLGPGNFTVKRFDPNQNDWVETTISSVNYHGNGTYTLNFESPIADPYYKWLFITVEDHRGLVVICSTYSFIEFILIVESEVPGGGPTDDEVYTLECGINGTWYWNGKRLQVETNGTSVLPPIPTIPIKLFRVNVTENGVDSPLVPALCQYEIWDRINWHGRILDVPRDLADPDSPFNSSNRIVFQVRFPPSVDRQKVMLWWEDDLDAPPYQAPSDLEYFEFIGVDNPSSPDYTYPDGTPIDYQGVAALIMGDPATGFCFGPWNIHGYGKHNNGSLTEWRPYGSWEIKYWYGGETSARAVVRLIAVLNSTEVQCVYNENHHSSEYYDTYAIVFLTANVSYLQMHIYIYWEGVPQSYDYPYGVWFASVMGKGEPEWFAYLNQTEPFSDEYDWQDPTHEEYKYPGYWAAHWNENFGRGLIINQEGLESLQSLVNLTRTRFSITEAMSGGGGRQGSIELEAVNCRGNEYRVPAGTYYAYNLVMWMYDGGEGSNGYEEVNDYYWMFLEDYYPTIVIPGG